MEKTFDKINISDICEPCYMNRKSFYYHFKDKYDLVNWIFDTEFMEFVGQKSLLQSWDFFKEHKRDTIYGKKQGKRHDAAICN